MYGHNATAKANFIDGFSPALDREKEKINVKKESAAEQQQRTV